MSTTAVPSITSENYTLAVVAQQVIDEKSKEVSTVYAVLPEDRAKEKAEKEGGTVSIATANIPIVNDEGAFTELVPDVQERLNIVNRGLKVKLQNKFRALLRDTNDEGELSFIENLVLSSPIPALRQAVAAEQMHIPSLDNSVLLLADIQYW